MLNQPKAIAPLVCLAASVLAGCANTQPASGGANASKTMALVRFDTCARPNYPREDLRAGHQGTVKLAFLVSAQGTVLDSKVLQSSGYPAMDDAARGAISKCAFTPATLQGKPEQAWAPIMYVWKID